MEYVTKYSAGSSSVKVSSKMVPRAILSPINQYNVLEKFTAFNPRKGHLPASHPPQLRA